MKQSGVRLGVLMQLARRGGMSGLPIILPEKADGYVQDIRDETFPQMCKLEILPFLS